ncbi:signal peptide peptidase SppA [Candidatus Binatia bacterium]|jgi:protease-4|nr:signal peptide peptidase SppA [Candidatus Binatia bacterium]
MPTQPVRRAFGFIGGFLALFFVLAFAMALLRAGKGGTGFLPGESVVAVVPLDGEIERSDDFVETLDDLQDDQRFAAVVVRINSPGGAVAPSQEMYDAVRRLGQKKPVIASLGSVAASGGYYVASAADTIVASPGTLTGSIGVIMSLTNVRGLMEKLGVEATIVTAGKWKDTGSPFRAVTPEERAMLQKMADQVHTQFIDAVAAGRKLDQAKVREIGNGRVYTGEEAKQIGLVDELGGLEDAVRIAGARGGITGKPVIERVSPRRGPWWWRALFSEQSASSIRPGSVLALLDSLARLGGQGGTAESEVPQLLWRLPFVTEGFRW